MADETIYFFHLEEPFGCLSNASRHQIYLDGTYWQTVEHYFQASKFEDAKLRNEVHRAETPSQARRLGRKHRRSQRRDWHKIKVDVMRKALAAKAEQHADVRATLLVTAPARLVQRSDAGDYWGGKKNMLGKLWMQARRRLAEAGEFDALSRPLAPPWEKYPELGFGSMGWRMGYGEAYLDEWEAYFYGLSPAGRERYQQMFPAPDGWAGFYVE
jgi:hypothetical protein